MNENGLPLQLNEVEERASPCCVIGCGEAAKNTLGPGRIPIWVCDSHFPGLERMWKAAERVRAREEGEIAGCRVERRVNALAAGGVKILK